MGTSRLVLVGFAVLVVAVAVTHAVEAPTKGHDLNKKDAISPPAIQDHVAAESHSKSVVHDETHHHHHHHEHPLKPAGDVHAQTHEHHHHHRMEKGIDVDLEAVLSAADKISGGGDKPSHHQAAKNKQADVGEHNAAAKAQEPTAAAEDNDEQVSLDKVAEEALKEFSQDEDEILGHHDSTHHHSHKHATDVGTSSPVHHQDTHGENKSNEKRVGKVPVASVEQAAAALSTPPTVTAPTATSEKPIATSEEQTLTVHADAPTQPSPPTAAVDAAKDENVLVVDAQAPMPDLPAPQKGRRKKEGAAAAVRDVMTVDPTDNSKPEPIQKTVNPESHYDYNHSDLELRADKEVRPNVEFEHSSEQHQHNLQPHSTNTVNMQEIEKENDESYEKAEEEEEEQFAENEKLREEVEKLGSEDAESEVLTIGAGEDSHIFGGAPPGAAGGGEEDHSHHHRRALTAQVGPLKASINLRPGEQTKPGGPQAPPPPSNQPPKTAPGSQVKGPTTGGQIGPGGPPTSPGTQVKQPGTHNVHNVAGGGVKGGPPGGNVGPSTQVKERGGGGTHAPVSGPKPNPTVGGAPGTQVKQPGHVGGVGGGGGGDHGGGAPKPVGGGPGTQVKQPGGGGGGGGGPVPNAVGVPGNKIKQPGTGGGGGAGGGAGGGPTPAVGGAQGTKVKQGGGGGRAGSPPVSPNGPGNQVKTPSIGGATPQPNGGGGGGGLPAGDRLKQTPKDPLAHSGPRTNGPPPAPGNRIKQSSSPPSPHGPGSPTQPPANKPKDPNQAPRVHPAPTGAQLPPGDKLKPPAGQGQPPTPAPGPPGNRIKGAPHPGEPLPTKPGMYLSQSMEPAPPTAPTDQPKYHTSVAVDPKGTTQVHTDPDPPSTTKRTHMNKYMGTIVNVHPVKGKKRDKRYVFEPDESTFKFKAPPVESYREIPSSAHTEGEALYDLNGKSHLPHINANGVDPYAGSHYRGPIVNESADDHRKNGPKKQILFGNEKKSFPFMTSKGGSSHDSPRLPLCRRSLNINMCTQLLRYWACGSFGSESDLYDESHHWSAVCSQFTTYAPTMGHACNKVRQAMEVEFGGDHPPHVLVDRRCALKDTQTHSNRVFDSNCPAFVMCLDLMRPSGSPEFSCLIDDNDLRPLNDCSSVTGESKFNTPEDALKAAMDKLGMKDKESPHKPEDEEDEDDEDDEDEEHGGGGKRGRRRRRSRTTHHGGGEPGDDGEDGEGTPGNPGLGKLAKMKDKNIKDYLEHGKPLLGHGDGSTAPNLGPAEQEAAAEAAKRNAADEAAMAGMNPEQRKAYKAAKAGRQGKHTVEEEEDEEEEEDLGGTTGKKRRRRRRRKKTKKKKILLLRRMI